MNKNVSTQVVGAKQQKKLTLNQKYNSLLIK